MTQLVLQIAHCVYLILYYIKTIVRISQISIDIRRSIVNIEQLIVRIKKNILSITQAIMTASDTFMSILN